METVGHKAVLGAVTTINAPLPVAIDWRVLLACLRLENTEGKWRPHLRAFFGEVGLEVIMDMVVEGSISFDKLAEAISFWGADEDSENARWIREMAPVSVADIDGVDPASRGLGNVRH